MLPAMSRTTPLALLLLMVLAGSTTGCVALAVGAGVGAGAYSHAENEVVREFDATLDQSWRASIAALNALGHPVDTGATHGPTEGELDVDDVTVRVERIPEDHTRVRVRAGVFKTDDNIRRARLVMEEIAKRL